MGAACLGQAVPWLEVAGFGWGLSAGIGKWPSDNAVSLLLWLSPSAVSVAIRLWDLGELSGVPRSNVCLVGGTHRHTQTYTHRDTRTHRLEAAR